MSVKSIYSPHSNDIGTVDKKLGPIDEDVLCADLHAQAIKIMAIYRMYTAKPRASLMHKAE